jgi:hypothetical protein
LGDYIEEYKQMRPERKYSRVEHKAEFKFTHIINFVKKSNSSLQDSVKQYLKNEANEKEKFCVFQKHTQC